MIEDQLEGLRIESEHASPQPSDFAKAARTLVAVERPPVQAFIPPKSFDNAKTELLKRLEVRKPSYQTERVSEAYSDLGGGSGAIELPHRQLLLEKTLLLKHEPWHREIDDAVERFGLAEISAEDLKEVDSERSKTTLRQLYAFVEKIKTITRLINESGCDTRPGYCDRDISSRFQGRTQDEMQAYVQVLSQLLLDIHEEGIDQVLDAKLGVRGDMNRRRHVLDEAWAERRKHPSKQVQLGKDSRGQVQVRWQPTTKAAVQTSVAQ